MKKKTVKLLEKDLLCASTDDGMLLWPEEWTRQLQDDGLLDAAIAIMEVLPACAVKTPWIIGSGRYTLFGSERTESESHMTGQAVDMSPMFSDVEVLDPSGRIMGLAWNVVSLDIISKAYIRFPHFVVEGDHLHVQPAAVLDESHMPVAFTMPSWYAWTEDIRSDAAVRDIDNSFWLWASDETGLSLMTRDELNVLFDALRV